MNKPQPPDAAERHECESLPVVGEMPTPKRYNFAEHGWYNDEIYHTMDEAEHGEYVKWEDYDAIQRELSSARARCEGMVEQLEHDRSVHDVVVNHRQELMEKLTSRRQEANELSQLIASLRERHYDHSHECCMDDEDFDSLHSLARGEK